MADVDFPFALPLPDATLGGPFIVPVIGSPMETGYLRQRRQYTTIRKQWAVSWTFTLEQYTAFLAWWNHSINAGVSYFNLTLPVDQDYTSQEVCFLGGNISDSYRVHNNQVVSGTLVSKGFETASDAYLYVFELWGGDLDTFLEWAADFHTFVHTTLPLAINGD